MKQLSLTFCGNKKREGFSGNNPPNSGDIHRTPTTPAYFSNVGVASSTWIILKKNRRIHSSEQRV
ncbi:hypothetical protein L1049_020039 [Liquidambar formosana]|uniref:Uncharacterized protein n=1 Tax=Liquidambar formosana TaxID=63359 RepID=A0AAP0SDF1_LIQFO